MRTIDFFAKGHLVIQDLTSEDVEILRSILQKNLERYAELGEKYQRNLSPEDSTNESIGRLNRFLCDYSVNFVLPRLRVSQRLTKKLSKNRFLFKMCDSNSFYFGPLRGDELACLEEFVKNELEKDYDNQQLIEVCQKVVLLTNKVKAFLAERCGHKN